MLSDLDPQDRLLLLKFVCAFAWSDLEVQSSERRFVHRLVKKLELLPEDAAEVERWLDEPPDPEEVDPERVPRAHRQLFLQYARKLIESDGVVDENEAELFEALEEILG
jgi:uncharacterized tellurite resistance protein B-like protein